MHQRLRFNKKTSTVTRCAVSLNLEGGLCGCVFPKELAESWVQWHKTSVWTGIHSPNFMIKLIRTGANVLRFLQILWRGNHGITLENISSCWWISTISITGNRKNKKIIKSDWCQRLTFKKHWSGESFRQYHRSAQHDPHRQRWQIWPLVPCDPRTLFVPGQLHRMPQIRRWWWRWQLKRG